MGFAGAFDVEILPPNHRRALQTACTVIIDEFFDALEALSDDATTVAGTFIEDYLPRRYRARYTPAFARSFLVSVITVAWKLGQETWLGLALEGQVADFSPFIDVAFEDTDFQYLFDDAWDGIDESEVGRVVGITPLRFAEWFEPYHEGYPTMVHPYYTEHADVDETSP